jgi:hypothetical protein
MGFYLELNLTAEVIQTSLRDIVMLSKTLSENCFRWAVSRSDTVNHVSERSLGYSNCLHAVSKTMQKSATALWAQTEPNLH